MKLRTLFNDVQKLNVYTPPPILKDRYLTIKVESLILGFRSTNEMASCGFRIGFKLSVIIIQTTIPWSAKRSCMFIFPTVHAMTLMSRLRRVGKAAFKYILLFNWLLFRCLVNGGQWFIRL